MTLRRPLFDKFTRDELIELVIEQDAMIYGKRFCSDCKQYKLVGEFSINRGRKDGLQRICRACASERGAAWRKDNAEYMKLFGKARWQKLKEAGNDSK